MSIDQISSPSHAPSPDHPVDGSGGGGFPPPRREHHVAIFTIGLLLLLAVSAGIGGLVITQRSGDAANRPVAIPPAARLAADSPRGSGVYVGAAKPGLLANFATWRGVPVRYATDYLSVDTWKDISAPDWWLQRWHRTGLPLMLGVPMLPNLPSTTMTAGAHGAYNHYFRDLAQDLVRYGNSHASLRIGWEMNGAWYRWSAQPNPAAWIAYYRQIVTTMRSVQGAHFSFDWNPNLGNSGMSAAAAYPGNAYVDVIGMDVYDWKWNDPGASPAARWSWIRRQPSGLDWLSSFAVAHNKPIALPEWSLAHRNQNSHGGGGDDPYFVQHLLTWAKNRHAAYEAYFNDGKYALRNFPHAQRAYRHTERALHH